MSTAGLDHSAATGTKSQEAPMSHLSAARMALLGLAVILLQACGHPQDDLRTGGIPDDYRTRHPIQLAEVEQSIDIPVASGDRALPIGTQDVVSGFVSEYRTSGAGVLRIAYPSGSANAAAAQGLRRKFRQLVLQSGVASSRISEGTYTATGDDSVAPVRLSFRAIKASTGPCGQWPEDILHSPNNTNWENFGCATQNNLAAQIANPTDLVSPRAMTAIDAKRRTTVIELYRNGKSTASN
jgi:pilus assembly protein CpaD